MKTKKSLKLSSVTLLTVMTLSQVAPVFAQEYTVTNGTVNVNHAATTTVDGPLAADGQITIQGNPGQSIKNKKFELFQIFHVENARNLESINYRFNDKYKKSVQTVVAAALNKRDNVNLKPEDVSEYMAIDYIQSLNTRQVEGAKTPQRKEASKSAFRYFTEDLKDQIRKDKIEGDIIKVESSNDQNSFTISGLAWGYYFIDEISEVDKYGGPGKTTEDEVGQETDGKHFASSMIMVDTVNNNFTITLKSTYPQLIKKIKEDDKSEINKNIKDQEGWNDIGDYQIGQTVPYKYESTIPNMNAYNTYYYALEDKMDQALQFQADKAKIKLTLTDGVKSYVLKNDEYNLSTWGTNVSAQHAETKATDAFNNTTSTFGIEIEDIKAIVDREFAKFNADNENDYSNLTLKTEYEAILTDAAAQDTGRPGFENDARLIFSNDPDSDGTGRKGKTPWDTVVAFTYRLNGLKVNNNNMALDNAHFKLYADKEMTKEVFVKKAQGNATVANPVPNNTPADQAPVAEIPAGTPADPAANEKQGKSNKTGTVGQTTNLQTDGVTANANAYIVATGDQAPADAAVIMSDKDGNFSIVGLDQGTYYLKEVKAPQGYRLLEDPIEITVEPNFTEQRDLYVKGDGATEKTLKALNATGDIREFYDEIFKTQKTTLTTHVAEGAIDIKVVNEKLNALPKTGSDLLKYGIGLGVFAIAAAAVVLFKPRKKTQN